MIDPDYDVGVDWVQINDGKPTFTYSIKPNFTSALMITKVWLELSISFSNLIIFLYGIYEGD